jgi:hypothetical protein
MNLICDSGGLYFTAGPVFHKCLETGFQRQRKNEGFDFSWRFNTRGDHAGLKFSFEMFGLLFEFNIYDRRHWDWDTDTWRKYDADD